jgi:S1-C subfamily serine protease
MGVKFVDVDVSVDQAAAQEMVSLTGQMGVPVIVIDGEVIIGFDRQRITELVKGANTAPPKIRFGLRIADAQKVPPPPGTTAIAGAFIGDVAPGYLGEKAGLKTGDIITRINNQPINGAADVEHALAGVKQGDIMAFNFNRGGQPGKSEIVI